MLDLVVDLGSKGLYKKLSDLDLNVLIWHSFQKPAIKPARLLGFKPSKYEI